MQQAALLPLRESASTLSEQVYGALVDAIMQHHIVPGERLMLDDLAVQLRVSRTPVRDALSRLAAEGLVQPAGRRGFRVTPLTGEDLTELYNLRLMCELFAVEEGIGNVTPALLRHLEGHAEACIQLSGTLDIAERLQLMERDRDLHRLIIGLAGNARLAELFERLSIHVQSFRTGIYAMVPEELQAAYRAEHGGIIAALRLGDAEAAKQALRAHIGSGLRRSIAYLQLAQAGRS